MRRGLEGLAMFAHESASAQASFEQSILSYSTYCTGQRHTRLLRHPLELRMICMDPGRQAHIQELGKVDLGR